MKKTLAMFDDVRLVLDKAVAARGGTFRCAAHGTAVHWRQRAYQFRKLYRDKIGGETSPYDRLTFRKILPDSCDIVISVIETPGEFIPNNEIEEVQDELMDEALDLAGKLDLL